jgi:hypothetical protein
MMNPERALAQQLKISHLDNDYTAYFVTNDGNYIVYARTSFGIDIAVGIYLAYSPNSQAGFTANIPAYIQNIVRNRGMYLKFAYLAAISE